MYVDNEISHERSRKKSTGTIEKSGKMSIQQDVIRLAENGHNLFITGCPGTGKTYALCRIIEVLTINQRNIAVTASTGKASSVLKSVMTISELPVITVHRFSGILDGRYENEEILNLILNNEDLCKQKHAIQTTDVLIIDEISMLSMKTFEQIEFLLRNVRKNNKPFGGIQVILSGDMHQLPPVANIEYGDNGDLVIKSSLMEVFHVLELKEVHRQDEPDMIKAIHEVSRGEISTPSERLLNRLQRNLPPGERPVKLYAVNFDVDVWNAKCLLEMDGEEHVYYAVDEGDTRGCAGEEALHVKVGCPVILIVNLSDELVNGLSGVVREANEDNIVVQFESIQKQVKITTFSFTKYSAQLKRDIGCRKQIPLKLAFAMTIHKSQGMTIKRVSLECKGIFQFGQLAVGLSRVPNKIGLQVKNFHKKVLIKPPKHLTDFLNSAPLSIDDSRGCCCNKELDFSDTSSNVPHISEVCHTTSETSSYSDPNVDADEDNIELLQILDRFEKEATYTDSKFELPNEINIMNILNAFKYDAIYTERQKAENEAIHYLQEHMEETKCFIQFVWDELCLIKERYFVAGDKLENKVVTQFYKNVNTFMLDECYKMRVRYLFGHNPSADQHNVIFKLTTGLRKEMIKIEAEPIKIEMREKAKAEKGKVFLESEGGRGKIRYIAGWCICRLKKKIKSRIVMNLYNAKQSTLVRQLILQKNLIEHLEANETELEHSVDKESLNEICRRQNIRRGLTNVSDPCFDFFLQLDYKVRLIQSETNLNLYGTAFSAYMKMQLKEDHDLSAKWINLFQSFEVPNSEKNNLNCAMDVIFDKVLQKYTMMSIAQLRREYLQEKNAEKTEATRKQIKMRTEIKKKRIFDINTIKNDSSECRNASHKRLQSDLLSGDCLLETKFKKTELFLLCEAYNLQSYKSLTTKKNIAEKLKPIIIESVVMPNYEIFNDTQNVQPMSPVCETTMDIVDRNTDDSVATTSNQAQVEVAPKRPSKKRGKKGLKEKRQKGPVKWPCGICHQDASFDSVGCDGCDTWFHGDCLKVDLDELDNEWFCQSCKEDMANKEN